MDIVTTAAGLALCASVHLPCSDLPGVMDKTGYFAQFCVDDSCEAFTSGQLLPDGSKPIREGCFLFQTANAGWKISLFLCRDGIPTS
jgi:hypothetical protein